MKKLFFLILSLSIFCGTGFTQVRQRHIIYILDCTASMNGYNGAENVWDSTKSFVLRTINNEDPNTLITILPFQGDVKSEITALKKDFNWNSTEASLNEYVKAITETNIVKAWSIGTSSRLIDPTMENIVILLTDGGDNAKGNTPEQLNRVFSDFCDKVKNTHGYYVQLTESATIPPTLWNIIENCATLKIIPPGANLEDFNEILGYSPKEIVTRHLPDTITVDFSNGKTIKTWIDNKPTKFVTITPIGDYQSMGHMKFLISPNKTYGDNIDELNATIDNSGEPLISFSLGSDIAIDNPEITLELRTAPARSLQIAANSPLSNAVTHTKSFLWIKESPFDTLTYDLGIKFNDAAIIDNSIVHMQLSGIDFSSSIKVLIDDTEIKDGEFWLSAGKSKGKINLIIPAETSDTTLSLSIKYISSEDLDIINGHKPQAFGGINLIGNYSKKEHWLSKVLIWIGICLLSILILWFAVLRNLCYRSIKNGYINIQHPTIQRIKLRGARKIVFSSQHKTQSWLVKVFAGKIKYITIPNLSVEFSIWPSRNNLIFRCSGNQIICTPSPILQKGHTYTILGAEYPQNKIIEFIYL